MRLITWFLVGLVTVDALKVRRKNVCGSQNGEVLPVGKVSVAAQHSSTSGHGGTTSSTTGKPEVVESGTKKVKNVLKESKEKPSSGLFPVVFVLVLCFIRNFATPVLEYEVHARKTLGPSAYEKVVDIVKARCKQMKIWALFTFDRSETTSNLDEDGTKGYGKCFRRAVLRCAQKGAAAVVFCDLCSNKDSSCLSEFDTVEQRDATVWRDCKCERGRCWSRLRQSIFYVLCCVRLFHLQCETCVGSMLHRNLVPLLMERPWLGGIILFTTGFIDTLPPMAQEAVGTPTSFMTLLLTGALGGDCGSYVIAPCGVSVGSAVSVDFMQNVLKKQMDFFKGLIAKQLPSIPGTICCMATKSWLYMINTSRKTLNFWKLWLIKLPPFIPSGVVMPLGSIAKLSKCQILVIVWSANYVEQVGYQCLRISSGLGSGSPESVAATIEAKYNRSHDDALVTSEASKASPGVGLNSEAKCVAMTIVITIAEVIAGVIFLFATGSTWTIGKIYRWLFCRQRFMPYPPKTNNLKALVRWGCPTDCDLEVIEEDFSYIMARWYLKYGIAAYCFLNCV